MYRIGVCEWFTETAILIVICLSSCPITNYLITNSSIAYNAHWSMNMSG